MKVLRVIIIGLIFMLSVSGVANVQDEFAGGTGTSDDPYLIETIQHLNNVRHHEGSYFKQISDLDFNNYSENQKWEPIGKYDPDDLGFIGVYDGNNKIIKNLSSLLFGASDKNFTLKNLSLKNVSGDSGLIGSNAGTIKNCNISGNIYGDKYEWFGALASVNRGTIINCNAMIEITANQVNAVGGLVGGNMGYIYNSHSKGKIIGRENRLIGGLVGSQSNIGTGHLINSSSDVDIFANLTENGSAGGLVGYLSGVVENSYAMGNIIGEKGNLKNLIGSYDINIDRGNTFAMGKVLKEDFNEKDSLIPEKFKLIKSINENDLQEEIKDLNLNKRDYKGRTLLHYAAIYNNNSAVIQELIDTNMNINTRDTHGYTPLHYAAQYNNVKVLEVFLDTEVDLEKKEEKEQTPLHLASRYNDLEVVERLIRAGAEIEARDENNQRPLHLAAANNNTKVVELLIEENAEVDAEGIWEATPLQLAVLYNGNLNVINKLIEAGADIEKKSSAELNEAIGGFDDRYADKRELNPLSLVTYNGHFNYRYHSGPEPRIKDVMKLLINEGVDVNSRFDSRSVRNRFHGQPKLRKTILIWSIEYFNDPEFIDFLLREGAGEYPDLVGVVEGTSGRSALHQAVFNENLEIIKLLIEDYDADVDALKHVSSSSKTPLMIAAEMGNKEIVNYLLEAGADGSLEYEDKTAYDYFKTNKELEGTDTYWRLNDAQYE